MTAVGTATAVGDLFALRAHRYVTFRALLDRPPVLRQDRQTALRVRRIMGLRHVGER